MTITTSTETVGCDYCFTPVAIDDYPTLTALVSFVRTDDGSIYCETCGVTADGWPVSGVWTETGDTLDIA